MAVIKYLRLALEAVFIYFFIGVLFSFEHNNAILRIWVFTLLIFASFIFLRLYLDKTKAKNLLNSTIVFFVVFSLAQTAKNIFELKPGNQVFAKNA